MSMTMPGNPSIYQHPCWKSEVSYSMSLSESLQEPCTNCKTDRNWTKVQGIITITEITAKVIISQRLFFNSLFCLYLVSHWADLIFLPLGPASQRCWSISWLLQWHGKLVENSLKFSSPCVHMDKGTEPANGKNLSPSHSVNLSHKKE